MRRTTIVVDDEQLARAQKALGTTGLKDTVDRALQEVIAAEAGRRFIQRLRRMEDMDLSDPKIMAAAWRE